MQQLLSGSSCCVHESAFIVIWLKGRSYLSTYSSVASGNVRWKWLYHQISHLLVYRMPGPMLYLHLQAHKWSAIYSWMCLFIRTMFMGTIALCSGAQQHDCAACKGICDLYLMPDMAWCSLQSALLSLWMQTDLTVLQLSQPGCNEV